MLLRSDKQIGLVIEIQDHLYSVHRIPAGLDQWACEMHNHSNGERYRVARDFDGRWHCQCRAFKFAKTSPHSCKHTRNARDLTTLAKEITS